MHKIYERECMTSHDCRCKKLNDGKGPYEVWHRAHPTRVRQVHVSINGDIVKVHCSDNYEYMRMIVIILCVFYKSVTSHYSPAHVSILATFCNNLSPLLWGLPFQICNLIFINVILFFVFCLVSVVVFVCCFFVICYFV